MTNIKAYISSILVDLTELHEYFTNVGSSHTAKTRLTSLIAHGVPRHTHRRHPVQRDRPRHRHRPHARRASIHAPFSFAESGALQSLMQSPQAAPLQRSGDARGGLPVSLPLHCLHSAVEQHDSEDMTNVLNRSAQPIRQCSSGHSQVAIGDVMARRLPLHLPSKPSFP